MYEGISQTEKEKTLEQIRNYQIWTNNFLEGLNTLKDSISDINSPEDLMSKIGFGYEQYSRILNDIFEGKIGEMAMDMGRLIKEVDPTIEVGGLWKYIPLDLISKIEKFRKTRDKSDLPTEKEIEIATADIQTIVGIFDRLDITK